MNYTMGRYIDELDDEGRDRLVTAEDFSDGQWWDGRCGCLVTTAVGGRCAGDGEKAARGHRLGARWQEQGPAYRYPYAVARFGKDRVVRAIKLRAAAATTADTLPHVSEPTPAPTEKAGLP